MSTRNINLTDVHPGDKLTARMFNDIHRAIKSQQLVAGKGIRLRQNNAGTIIDADISKTDIQNQKDYCVVGKINERATEYSTEGCYKVDIYENGIGRAPTQTVIAFCVESASNADIPNGTWVLLHGEELALIRGAQVGGD